MLSGNLLSSVVEREISRNLQVCLMIPQAILSLLSLPSPRHFRPWLYHPYVDSFQCISLPQNTPSESHRDILTAYLTSHLEVITNISKSLCPKVNSELALTKPASSLMFSTHKVVPPSPLHSCPSPKFMSHS